MIRFDFAWPGFAVISLCLGLIIALFLPLRRCLRRVIGSQWLCVLWLALLIRLLLPWPLETRLGVINSWPNHSIPATGSTSPWKVKISFPVNTIAKAGPSQLPPVLAPTLSAAPGAQLDIPLLVWLCGFVASLTLLAWRRHQTRQLAVETLPVEDERLLAIYSSIPIQWRRNVELRTTRVLAVPTLAGVFHPQIWMPQAWLAQFTDAELRSILLHELGHARRGDLAVQWLFAFAQCLHWFNPFVWLATRAARFDREMACDEWVLTRNDADGSRAYGATLLKTARLLCAPLSAPATTVAMASGRQSLRERIAGIGAFRPVRTWPGLVGIALMIAALAVVTTKRTIAGQTTAPAIAQTTAISSPTAQFSAPPEAKPDAGSAATGGSSGPFIKLEAKFAEIEKPAWTKLCTEDPDLQRIALAVGDLDEDRNIYHEPGGPILPNAAGRAALNALGTSKWTLKEGAWQTSGAVSAASVLSGEQMEKMLKWFDQQGGLDFLSAPTVTARQGQRTTVEVVREYRYPSEFEPDKRSPSGWDPSKFATQGIGVSLEATCTFETSGSLRGMFSLDLNPEVSEFLGFLPEKDASKGVRMTPPYRVGPYWKPVFSILKGKTDLSVLPDQTILLAGVTIDRRSDRLLPTQSKPVTRKEVPERRVILIFVTPSIAAPKGIPLSDHASPTPAGTKDPKEPYAIPVPGRPGFVTSPYFNGGYIDVRGFSQNTEVQDPYSGKMFLVP